MPVLHKKNKKVCNKSVYYTIILTGVVERPLLKLGGEMNKNLTDEMKCWLYSSIRLDLSLTIYKDYAITISDMIFEKIKSSGGLRDKKYEEVFISLIINLRVAFELNRPLRYNRDSHKYPQHGVGFKMLMNLIDRLLELGYISGETGYQGNKDIEGYASRIWVEHRINTIYDLFITISPDDVIKRPPNPLVRLMTRKKKISGKTIEPEIIHYRKNPNTDKMEDQLKQYQELMDDTNIELHINWDKLNEDEQNNLYNIICKNRYSRLQVVYPTLNTNTKYINIKSINILYISKQYYKYYDDSNTTNNTNTIYLPHISVSNTNDRRIVRSPAFEKSPDFIDKSAIRGIGIRLKYKTLHRSFTKNFKLGGRFYGASWIDFSKIYRQNIFINDEQTCEPDFSSYHLRMLYHKKGIDYRDDVYTFIRPEYRKLGKAAAMSLINCKTPSSAHSTVKSMFGWKKIDGVWQVNKKNKLIKTFGDWILDKEFIDETIDSFKQVHSDIIEFIATDQGIRLQNTDSIIASGVLQHFIDQGIPILCVHDSFIAQQRYREELVEIMKEKYRDEIGYDPIVH